MRRLILKLSEAFLVSIKEILPIEELPRAAPSSKIRFSEAADVKHLRHLFTTLQRIQELVANPFLAWHRGTACACFACTAMELAVKGRRLVNDEEGCVAVS